MWQTSKSPAVVRTAMCSAVMPEYSTGMSQPPNGTMRAPRATCEAWSGVFFSEAVADSVMGYQEGPRVFAARHHTGPMPPPESRFRAALNRATPPLTWPG